MNNKLEMVTVYGRNEYSINKENMYGEEQDETVL